MTRPRPLPSETELAEEQERDAAARDDSALVRYEAKWRRILRKLQQAHPGRWRVPGLSQEEVRDLLTLRLIEVLRSEPGEFWRYRRPGQAWALQCMQEHLRALRKSFRLNASPADLRDAPLLAPTIDQEEQWVERETQRGRALAQQRAERGLSRPQRQWWAALKLSAQAGAFFQRSELPNLSAASRLLGKDRSSAQRAYQELQARFGKEWKRLG